MKNSLILIGILLVILCFIQPNFYFMQKIGMGFVNIGKKIENTEDISKYRTNPQLYFSMLSEKQNNNINNAHVKYIDNIGVHNYYRKNRLQKEISYMPIQDKPNEFFGLINIVKGSFQYVTPVQYNGVAPMVVRFKNTDKIYNKYMFPDVNPDDTKSYKFIKEKVYEPIGNKCAVWINSSQEKAWDNRTKRYVSNVSIEEYCFDESLGINYYATYGTSLGEKDNSLFKIDELKIGTVKEKDFLFPKQAKFVIDFKLIDSRDTKFEQEVLSRSRTYQSSAK